MGRANRIEFNKSTYPTENALWASVGALLKILNETRNIAVVLDGGDSIIVDYDSMDDPYAPRVYWLYPDEYEQIEIVDEEDEDCDDTVL